MARREPISSAEYAYTVLLQPEPEGGYTVTCPALPGLVTYGESLAEARAMAAEAVAAYLESLQKDGGTPIRAEAHPKETRAPEPWRPV